MPNGLVKEFDVDCYLLKTVTCKSKKNNNMFDVSSFIVLTTDQNLLCISVAEKGFILSCTFPKENSFIRISNIQFVNCTRIDHRDLSFETFDSAVVINPDEDHLFVYDTFKFTVNSSVKQSTATASDNMKTLKLLVKETSMMKMIKRKVRHIIN